MVIPTRANRQKAALSPFSCVVPQLLPSLVHNLAQTSIQEEMLARSAMD